MARETKKTRSFQLLHSRCPFFMFKFENQCSRGSKEESPKARSQENDRVFSQLAEGHTPASLATGGALRSAGSGLERLQGRNPEGLQGASPQMAPRQEPPGMQRDDAEGQRCKRIFEGSQRFVDSVDPLRIRLRVGASDGVGSTFKFGAFMHVGEFSDGRVVTAWLSMNSKWCRERFINLE